MQNKYPLWKYLLLLTVLALGVLYALPNFFGDEPAVQVSPASSAISVDAVLNEKIKKVLTKEKIPYKSIHRNDEDILIRFFNTNDQLKAKDLIKNAIGEQYTVAIKLARTTPRWLRMLGATPMKLGLDLMGGVHFLLDVDVDGVIAKREEGLIKNISQDLRAKKIRYASLRRLKNGGILMRFRNAELRNKASSLINQHYPELLLNKENRAGNYTLFAQISPKALNDIRKYTIEQTMTILKNRVNELGVAEVVVQQQGATRVGVDLPGIQDATRAQQILGGTATLEFRMVDEVNDPIAAAKGTVPIGSKLYTENTPSGRPLLLKNQVILSGDSITSASSSFSETGQPAVGIQLGGGGESLFRRVTRANIGKLMAIVYVETKADSKMIGGKLVRKTRKEERVISVATIQSALGNNFQITGLSDPNEARNLALLLRAGALPAAIDPVEERIVGPTLGMENIHRGMVSLIVGTVIVLILMALYYRIFGLIADVALLINLVLLIAVLSLIDATLTLPGIAGIVLTMGMAVDANVLIYERIREEMRHGMGSQASIYAGFERAFSTIVDANVTTLIVAVVLYAIGTGPVRGFAVTLMIGLVTSMITAITFTRGMVNLLFGGRQVKRLPIGI